MTFTSGRIAVIEGQSEELSDYQDTFQSNGRELEALVSVDQDIVDLKDSVVARTGLAAQQQLEESDDVQLQNGDIDIGRTQDIEWVWTNYWVVPDEFIVVGSTKGEFAFELLEEVLDAKIKRVNFNLSEIIDDYPGQWMGSFEERADNVQRGTLYGDRIEDDPDMGNAFLESSKRQIGPWINYGDESLKVRIGREGWAQVVSPGTYNREKYLGLVRDILLDYRIEIGR